MEKRWGIYARFVLCLAGWAWGAQCQADEVTKYETRINALKASSTSWQSARQAGNKAAFFCVNCHGEAGISTLGTVPNLAGQNPVYLMTQIQKFADGRRKDDFMSGLIKVLKEDDRLNMAVYYSSLMVLPSQVSNPRQVGEGKTLYKRACIGCHGADGHGNRKVARLAGQQLEYLADSLSKYRSRKEGRSDPVMSSVAANLSNDQIAAVAAYLSSLP